MQIPRSRALDLDLDLDVIAVAVAVPTEPGRAHEDGRWSRGFDTGESLVQRLERALHLEVGELGRDPFPARRRPHGAPPAIRAYSESGPRSTSPCGTIGGPAAWSVRASAGRGTTGR